MNLAEPTRFTGEETLPTKAPLAPISPEELAPHFPQLEILECLGRGGMGVVYKARQKSLNRHVALKLLAPERNDDADFAARFQREAHALAALGHPNIVTVHDFGQAGGFYYLLMEFVDGVNLRQAMKVSRFTPEQALAMVPPICEALQYAHDHGIVHRDIKPENLLLDKQGRVKIADFGVAKIMGEGGAGLPPAGASDTGGTPVSQSLPAGTPAYMAPEQRRESAKVDHRADIYSLGVVLYEMLTGELPKGSLEPPSAHMRGIRVDVRLDEVVLRALQAKPELRYATAAEFRTVVGTVGRVERGHAAAASTAAGAAPRLKTAFGRFTTPEFLATPSGGFWKHQGIGELSLFDDRLEFIAGAEFTIIPFASLRQLGSARGPRWTSPAGHQYLSLHFDDKGARRHLMFQPGSQLIKLASDTASVAAEWIAAIQRAVKASGGAPIPEIVGRPVVVPASPWMAAALLLPLLLIAFGLLRASPMEVLIVLALGFAIIALIRRNREHSLAGPPEPPPPAGAAHVGPQSAQQNFAALLGLRSRIALRCLQLSWLGWLGFLGAVPGWHRMWGFTGFFGFIGLATIIELLHRARSRDPHPAMRTRWHKLWVGILLAVAIALPVHLFLLQVFVLPNDSASPELPRGSRVLVWKLSQSFAPGDMIVYREKGVYLAGRVVKSGQGELIVRRKNSGDIRVPRSQVTGKVIMQTRGSGGSREAQLPPAAPPASPPSAVRPSAVVTPHDAASSGSVRKVKKWQNEVPFDSDPQLRYVAWLPATVAKTLQLWTPEGATEADHGEISPEAWDFWTKYCLKSYYQHKGKGDMLPVSPRLIFFFSNPAIDEDSDADVDLFTSPQTEIPLKTWTRFPGNHGWIALVCPLSQVPASPSLQVCLHLTGGKWQCSEAFPTNYQGSRGFGNVMVTGSGEDSEHRAFITALTLTDDRIQRAPQWNMLATLLDGTVVSSGAANSAYYEGREVCTIRFDHRLSELSGFFMRWRERKTTRFDNVKLPPMPDAGL